VFALALLVAELVTGRHPLADTTNDFETLQAIVELRFPLPRTRSQLGDKLRALLVRDPLERTPAAMLALEFARIAERANLRAGPDVIADFVRSV